MRSEVLSEEMRYFKTTKEGEMGYGGEIDGYINEGRRIGRKEGREKGREDERKANILALIKRKLLTPEQIADAFNISVSEVNAIADML